VFSPLTKRGLQIPAKKSVCVVFFKKYNRTYLLSILLSPLFTSTPLNSTQLNKSLLPQNRELVQLVKVTVKFNRKKVLHGSKSSQFSLTLCTVDKPYFFRSIVVVMLHHIEEGF
jgi:hypothetical protein